MKKIIKIDHISLINSRLMCKNHRQNLIIHCFQMDKYFKLREWKALGLIMT